MMHADPVTWQSVAFFTGGVIGCAARAAVSQSQTFASRKTIADIVIGGLIGIVYPMIAPIPIPTTAHANLIQQAAFVALVSYFADHVLQNYFGDRINAIANVGKPPEEPKP